MKKRPFKILIVIMALGVFQLGFLNFKLTPSGKIISIHYENIPRISKTVHLIKTQYYDPRRIKAMDMLKEGFYELAKAIPEVLPRFRAGHLEFYLGPQKIDVPLTEIKELDDIFPAVSQAFEFLAKNYKGDTKLEDMEYAFIGGMLSVLDPHSNVLPPKAYEEFRQTTQGEYGGLGIVIAIKDRELTIVAPIEDTPAFRAGLKPDDKILQIDDQSTTNMSLTEAVDLMRGRPGTQVTLKINSKNLGTRDVRITREKIIIRSVVSKLITKNNKHFGVLRVKGFQEDTYEGVIKELKNLKKQAGGNLAGLVLDLRNNPGGLLDQAILLADKFLKTGDIVYTVGADNNDEEIAVARDQKSDILVPMIVLINQGSASASEIVAGALKNNDRALVMGQRSFGKGSVQSLFNLVSGSSLKLTVAQYLTPGRQSIQALGIVPDIHLYPSLIHKEFYDLIEDLDFGEEKLEAHLDSSTRSKPSTSLYHLTYLDEETDPTQTENSYVSKIKEDDFGLQLAVKILETAADRSAKKMLSRLKPLLLREASEQDALIVQALAKRGIDWTAGQKTNSPKLVIRHEFLDDKGRALPGPLKAGTNAILRVSVKNIGNQAVHRVITTIESLNPLLNHREFVIGKLAPGAERSADVKIEIPAEIIGFSETIRFKTFTEKTTDRPQTQYAATRFIEKEQPQFAYTYRIDDGRSPDTKGNKNGIPEPGERVNLEVSLKNLGPGESRNTIINIKNTEGRFVFLKKARERLGVLRPNQTATRPLTFNIKESFDKPEFAIDFFAIDDDTKASINDTLTFKLTQPLAGTPPSGKLQVAPTITISENTRQVADKVYLEGTVSHPEALKDVAIFVKGRKRVYINLENGAVVTKKNFKAVLPLEEGINPIVIQARGRRDLQSQKSLSIVYTQPDSVTTAKTE